MNGERLAGHPELLAKIEYMAEKDVMAGYDILSWETERQKDMLVPKIYRSKSRLTN